jgi:hypothetical protein
MSADNVAAKWAAMSGLRPVAPASGPEDPAEEVASNKCFATVWGTGRAAPMVEFRMLDGTAEAFGYSWLRRVAVDAGRRLILYFTPADRIILEGQNLHKLRGLLALHRVTWVECLDPLHAGESQDPVVTGITFELSERSG